MPPGAQAAPTHAGAPPEPRSLPWPQELASGWPKVEERPRSTTRYGGLNTHNLDNAHAIAPEKFLLATEACNCPGVVYEADAPREWWQRAEHLGMDILQLHWPAPQLDLLQAVDLRCS